jgi:hypothetical protein
VSRAYRDNPRERGLSKPVVNYDLTYGADAAVLLQTGMAVADKITDRQSREYHGKHTGGGQQSSGDGADD